MNIPLQQITDKIISRLGVELFVLRLDLIHPLLSGNKFFKLKYNVAEMKSMGLRKLLTFGGAFSNHIAATAAAGKEYDFETVGIIRGEELDADSNITLRMAAGNGMKLKFVTREEYRKRYRQEYHEQLRKEFGLFYLLPEGGSNLLAVKGCAEILNEVKIDFDFVCCPVGTGATLAGITSSLSQKQQAIGFAILADAKFLEEDVRKFAATYSGKEPHNCRIIHDYHFGRYGRTTKGLDDFINRFERENNIPLEPVYTGKMMFGIYDLIRSGYFVRGEKVIAVHTGGLQGKNR